MTFTADDAKEALFRLRDVKGRDRARLIESMFRLETNHFRSKQYAICGSPGMELGNWSNLDESKFQTIKMNDNHLTGDKKVRTFIIWHDVFEFCLYLSDYIDRYNGNFARWNSKDPEKQEKYRKTVRSVWPKWIK